MKAILCQYQEKKLDQEIEKVGIGLLHWMGLKNLKYPI